MIKDEKDENDRSSSSSSSSSSDNVTPANADELRKANV